MKEPKDMVLPMLKETRADIAALRARMDERFDEIDRAYWPLRVPVANMNLCIGTTRRIPE